MTFIETLESGTVIAVVSALVTVQVSLRRFHKEKLWERKLESYTAIIEALARLRIHLNAEIEQQIHYKPVADERIEELARRSESARDELALAAAYGTLVVSRSAHNALSTLLEQLDNAEYAESRLDHISERSRAVAECSEKMQNLAMRDLRGLFAVVASRVNDRYR